MYAAPKPINAPHVDEFRPRRKMSGPSPRRASGQPVDPMSLEYYGHPSVPASAHRYEGSDRPLMDHRASNDANAPPRRDMSAELRDGIERWQRSGAARPGDEHEPVAVKEEEPMAQPRPKIVLPFFDGLARQRILLAIARSRSVSCKTQRCRVPTSWHQRWRRTMLQRRGRTSDSPSATMTTHAHQPSSWTIRCCHRIRPSFPVPGTGRTTKHRRQ